MQTNRASLPVMNVQGKVDHLIMSKNGYRVSYDKYGRILMAIGGIIYNCKTGDSCMGIVEDHVEPGVSLKSPVEKEDNALQAFACIGSRMGVISGDTEGKEGYVTEKHGDIDHVIVYSGEEMLELIIVEGEVLIRACGQGLKLMDHEETQLMSIDPALFEGLEIMEKEQGVKVPVVICVPTYLVGNGLGSITATLGDYDIMMQDAQINKEFGINGLHFGDLVMIQDRDNHNDPHYHRGAVSVGIIVYADPYTSGHGPRPAVIMSSWCGSIEPILDPNANVANYLYMKQLYQLQYIGHVLRLFSYAGIIDELSKPRVDCRKPPYRIHIYAYCIYLPIQRKL